VSALERLLLSAVLAVLLAVGVWRGIAYYGGTQYDAGYDAAVTAGAKLRDHEAEENRKTESDLRAQLAERDADAHRKERKYAENLADAQRRVRAGTDRLRCPTGPVPASAAAEDRPAAAGAPVDGQGPDVVPEAAANLLGISADVAGLVRRYDQVVERFEACRTVNAK
jgi:hypothetical protein